MAETIFKKHLKAKRNSLKVAAGGSWVEDGQLQLLVRPDDEHLKTSEITLDVVQTSVTSKQTKKLKQE